jgi:putative transposase
MMPRRPRLAVAGIPWHIIQRGNNRSACFFADDDYFFYLDQLQEQSAKFGCAVHAYCLMTNHVHLLLTPEAVDSASLMMKHLGQRCVQRINRTYRRSGTLWEGRFKSCLAQDEGYALTCYRYIELNPVRAGMVTHPKGYQWSSFRFNGEGEKSALLGAHSSYVGLGNNQQERLDAYNTLIESHMDDKQLDQIRTATNGNYALGDKRFQREIEQHLNRRVTPGRPGRPPK